MLLPQNIRDEHTTSIQTFSSGKRPSQSMGERGEINGQHKSGKIMPLEASITKTYIGDKLVLSAQVRDITQRKKVEVDLAEREARFSAVFNHAVEAIALLDETGCVLEINQAAREMLPIDEPVINKPLWVLPWSNSSNGGREPESEERLRDRFHQAMLGNTVHTRTSLDAGSDALDLDFSLTPIFNNSHHVLYCCYHL